MAITGLMPDFPWMTLLSVWRVTPRILAPSVMDNANGSRHALRTIRPGCAGFFIGMVVAVLVVVNQFNVKRIRAIKTENNAPVRPHRNRPKTLQVAFQRVKPIPGNVEGLRRGRGDGGGLSGLDGS